MFLKTRYMSSDTRTHTPHLQLQDKIASPIHPNNRAGNTSNATRSIARDAPELYTQFFWRVIETT